MDNYQVDLREKEMEELQNSPPEGIYFDGKKDDTLALEKDERGFGKLFNIKRKITQGELNLLAST